MSSGSERSLGQRLFEPTSIDKQSPFAFIITYALLLLWALVVLVPLYWVLITSFKEAGEVDNGPFYIPFVDFQPSLRFVPTSDPSRYVTITMKDYYDLDATLRYTIFWNRPSDGMWVDESANDPSMGTITDLNGNRISRRLKHFSGYLISGGEVCDAWSGSWCAPVVSFAGYLVGA